MPEEKLELNKYNRKPILLYLPVFGTIEEVIA